MVAIVISLLTYIVFITALSTLTLSEFGLLWMQSAAYMIINELAATPAFWLGLLLAPILSCAPSYLLAAYSQCFSPDLATQLALAERRAQEELRKDAAEPPRHVVLDADAPSAIAASVSDDVKSPSGHDAEPPQAVY